MAAQSPAVEAAIRIGVDIIRRHLPDPAVRIFLFGSRARGSAHERSDIDIGVEGPRPIDHATLAAIIEETDESPTLYSIDVVDFKRLPERFRDVALEATVEIA